MEKTVLIVEDERAIVDIVRFNLQREGYRTLEAMDGETGLQMARDSDPDIILLDVMLPKMNGFEICATLRAEGNAVPIIMLTARDEENDRVFGLETGADDYMTKPFFMKELLARVKANMRRRAMDHAAASEKPASPEDWIAAGELKLQLSTVQAFKNGEPLELTQKEFDLLLFLIRARGTVFSREDLMQQVWNYEYFGDMRTVDVTVRRLREKIEKDPGKPEYVLTKRGIGYYFAG